MRIIPRGILAGAGVLLFAAAAVAADVAISGLTAGTPPYDAATLLEVSVPTGGSPAYASRKAELGDLLRPSAATGSGATLAGPHAYYACATTCTVHLPVPVAGYEFCVFNDTNVSTVITIAALGSGAMFENQARTAYGTAGTGTFTSGGAVGDKACFVGKDSTHYWTISATGTWTAS